MTVHNVSQGNVHVLFANCNAWISVQNDCRDLRHVRAHLRQGTRPSKKQTNIKNVKRYLQIMTVARDGLLVVHSIELLSPIRQKIVIPCSMLEGLLTALHFKLCHPSLHQLCAVVHRYFWALDLERALESVSNLAPSVLPWLKLQIQSGAINTRPTWISWVSFQCWCHQVWTPKHSSSSWKRNIVHWSHADRRWASTHFAGWAYLLSATAVPNGWPSICCSQWPCSWVPESARWPSCTYRLNTDSTLRLAIPKKQQSSYCWQGGTGSRGRAPQVGPDWWCCDHCSANHLCP